MATVESEFVLIPRKKDPDDWKQHIPMLYWLPRYKYELFWPDVIGGLTLGVMSVPQSMALAALAGVTEVHGLYVGMLGPMIYSIFGTSGQLQFSTIAITFSISHQQSL